jgi:cytochrome c nitrite reductase small subunit
LTNLLSSARVRFTVLAALLGVLAGLGVFTFNYAEGLSYLSNDPNACVNCHIMREQYQGWTHSSHKEFAACNDCHTPHTFVRKWLTKGLNGWNHSFAFTTGNFDEPIRIKERNAKIVQENCVDCHQVLVSQIENSVLHDEEVECVRCHSEVGHSN